VEQPCGWVLQWTNKQLAQAGLRTLQTFNLTTALAGTLDCPCQEHGTSKCDCQMVVLFVYGHAGDPVGLILHGNHGRTWLSFAETPTANPNAGLRKMIQQILALQALDSQNLL
jgi:hypothetical protein